VLPSITSIFARGSAKLNFFSFELDVAYFHGTVATCTAIVEAAASIQWVKDGNPLKGGITSKTIKRKTSAFVSAHLSVSGTISSSDAGNYSCLVEGRATGVRKIQSLRLKFIPRFKNDPPFECSKTENSTTLYIKIRVHTDCINWVGWRLRSLAMALASAANGICTNNCPIPANLITIWERPQCNTGAAVFKVEISAPAGMQARVIYCALEEWQQRGGVIMIDDRFHLVGSLFFTFSNFFLTSQLFQSFTFFFLTS